ncbi:MAG TPA: hypothetical protein VHW64_13705 [Nocardioides sp.]|jgi:hypothetical protein|uniref:hypothetical protein n=1 Tax=Nocardioides sp. TaxID=35761 RepID=UPI002E32A0E5|nr:hypothetical protein [Nocardioides sp.]HEX3931756.1 hypothetical protein [Nocardioides sp.]
MASVVTMNGSLTCGHPALAPPPANGSAILTSTAKLTVNQAAVLVYGDVATYSWKPCAFQVSGATKSCTKAAPIAQGTAAKLTVGQQPVLLDNLQAGTDNPPPPPAPSVTVQAGQGRLSAS